LNLLVLAGAYPHADHPFAGVFSERCVQALLPLCERLEVVAPRPFAPPLLSNLNPRWKVYSRIVGHEIRNGVSVYRPAYPQIPRLGGAVWTDLASYLSTRRKIQGLHRRVGFDAILSFDLIAAGGLAWRLGQALSIPAAGWAFGEDVLGGKSSSYGAALLRTLQRLALIFYQSCELFEHAARLLGTSMDKLGNDRHLVLSHGIAVPPAVFRRDEARSRLRRDWGVGDSDIVVLYVGRILSDKGVFQFIDAVTSAAQRIPLLRGVLVGSLPGMDETAAVERRLRGDSRLLDRVRILPACGPEAVWDYLSAADIFGFPSRHREGMPNSLLEAMSMGVPAIAFAIPPVQEIEAGTGGLVLVPPGNSKVLAEQIVRLASDPVERTRVGKTGQAIVMERFVVRRNMATAFARLSEIAERWAASRRSAERA